MKTLRLLKPFFNFTKVFVFILTFFSVVLFSANANVELTNITKHNRDLLLVKSKTIEPQTMFLLGTGILGLAGVLRRKIK